MAEVFVAKTDELRDGDRRIVRSGKTEVGIFRERGRYFAYANLCLHQGGPACEGIVIPKVEDVLAPDKTFQGQMFNDSELHFVCPWHGWEYDIETGVCIGDRRFKLKRFEVVEKDGSVYVVV
jgi:nitrite reductase/ring-hydroxylating ferredoxin subunit